MKFKWNIADEHRWDRYKKEQGEEESDSGNYIGSVRAGDLCFDILEWGNHLWLDLYVGGVDTGYGYGADGYPYDFCDFLGFAWYDIIRDTTDAEFKEQVEKHITEILKKNPEYTTDTRNIKVNLIEKANMEMQEW